MTIMKKSILFGSLVMAAMAADADVQFDDMSVTATKSERVTQKVPTNIRVIGKEELQKKQMNNLQEVLAGTPGIVAENVNRGYSVSIYIRGSGIANSSYGTREISVLRDGVPLTSPTGYSSLDYIDTYDIEKVEITKGPGSIYSAGTTGGVIQILSKSVFDHQDNRVQIATGEYGMASANVNAGGKINDKNYLRVNVSNRTLENNWRPYNLFKTNMVSAKYGYLTDAGNPIEAELAYSTADYTFPESLDRSEYREYKDDGRVSKRMLDKGSTKEVYKRIVNFNVKYEEEMGSFYFKPRAFFVKEESLSHMSGVHYSPNQMFYGMDLEVLNSHDAFGNEAQLVTGLTYRGDKNPDSKAYSFDSADGKARLAGSREALLDYRKDLAEKYEAQNDLYGIYAQETLKPTDKLLVDFSLRFDTLKMTIDKTTYLDYAYSDVYDYTSGSFVPGVGMVFPLVAAGGTYYTPSGGTYTEDYEDSYSVYAARAGVSYDLTTANTLYFNLSQGNQVPYASQLQHSPDLKPSLSTSAEVGLKGRSERWSYDTAIYYNTVKDEIVDLTDANSVDGHDYRNAGETLKKGFEFSGQFAMTDNVSLGGSYGYNDYTYEDFTVTDGYGSSAVDVDISGNRFRYIPMNQYSLFVNYKDPSGLSAKIESLSTSSYFVDEFNTEEYEGYQLVTNLMVGYDYKKVHSVRLNIENLTDKRYATQVSGSDSFDPAPPRTAMLFYTYKF